MIHSPLNYMGGKFKLLPQLLPIFPQNISTFVDLFCGGCNVGINVKANKYIYNDNCKPLIDMYKAWQNLYTKDIITHIENRIEEYQLSKTNKEGFLLLRKDYNASRNPEDLFVLIAHSFSNQIRLNRKDEFNTPFGLGRSDFNAKMKENLRLFLNQIHNTDCSFTNISFEKFDLDSIDKDSFIYCDPPYFAMDASYNKTWKNEDQLKLLFFLSLCNQKGIKFALSNVIDCRGVVNVPLLDWIKINSFNCHDIYSNYSNCSYQLKDKKSKVKEVVVTNF